MSLMLGPRHRCISPPFRIGTQSTLSHVTDRQSELLAMYRMHLTPAALHKKTIALGGMSKTENENDDRSATSDNMSLAWAENGRRTRWRRTDQTVNHRPDSAIGTWWRGGVKNYMTVTVRGRTSRLSGRPSFVCWVIIVGIKRLLSHELGVKTHGGSHICRMTLITMMV